MGFKINIIYFPSCQCKTKVFLRQSFLLFYFCFFNQQQVNSSVNMCGSVSRCAWTHCFIPFLTGFVPVKSQAACPIQNGDSRSIWTFIKARFSCSQVTNIITFQAPNRKKEGVNLMRKQPKHQAEWTKFPKRSATDMLTPSHYWYQQTQTCVSHERFLRSVQSFSSLLREFRQILESGKERKLMF